MAIGGFARDSAPAPMSEINTTPLVDVMLVLLVVMMVTAPLLSQVIKVDLPHAASTPAEQRPDVVRLTLNAEGQTFWNGQTLDANALPSQLQQAAAHSPQPELHLSADRHTDYEHVARVLGAARQAGLTRLRFATASGDPDHANAPQ